MRAITIQKVSKEGKKTEDVEKSMEHSQGEIAGETEIIITKKVPLKMEEEERELLNKVLSIPKIKIEIIDKIHERNNILEVNPSILKIEKSEEKSNKCLKLGKTKPLFSDRIECTERGMVKIDKEVFNIFENPIHPKTSSKALRVQSIELSEEDAVNSKPKIFTIEKEELEQRSYSVEPKTVSLQIKRGISTGGVTGEPFKLFDLFFDFRVNPNQAFERDIRTKDRPICIFAYEKEEEYKNLLIMFLEEILHQRGVASPRYHNFTIGVDFDDYKEISNRELDIAVFEKCDAKFFSPKDTGRNLSSLFKGRIDELQTQPFRFVVFISSKGEVLEDAYPMVKYTYPSTYFLQLEKRPIPPEVKYRILHLLFGQFKTAQERVFTPDLEINGEWSKASGEYDHLIENVKEKYGRKFEQLHSKEHFVMKLLAYNTLVEMGFKEDSIRAEYNKGNKRIADIWADGIWIEAETHFSDEEKWKDPLQTIRDKILRVKRDEEFEEIWIVLRNFWALVYLDTWIKEQREYEKEGVPVRFFTLDLENEKIIELDEAKSLIMDIING